MIQEAIVVMTILGCGNQADQCDYVTTPNKRWNSVVACESAIPSHLNRHDGASYPVLMANCEKQAQAVAVKAEPVLLPQKSVFDELRAKSENTNIDLVGLAADRYIATQEQLTARIRAVFNPE